MLHYPRAYSVAKSFSLLCLFALLAPAARGVPPQWVRQLGTNDEEIGTGVSADGLGNVYFAGYAHSSLVAASAGDNDAFLTKYDAAGNLLWGVQHGSIARDVATGVPADLNNVYIAGLTDGNLGGPAIGNGDAFVTKFDSSGNVRWSKLLGTTTTEACYAVSANGLGDIFIGGHTFGGLAAPNAGLTDAFVAKYDAAGALQWSRQLGASFYDTAYGVKGDSLGNVFVVGDIQTGSILGPYDALIAKYDSAGVLQWTQQFGTPADDFAYSVTSDNFGNAYITGSTRGAFDGPLIGLQDVTIAKFSPTGALLWKDRRGTNAPDMGYKISSDNLGSIYITGETWGHFAGTSAGSIDTFLLKYDVAGNPAGATQLGSFKTDYGYAVSADGISSVYIAGKTSGAMAGNSRCISRQVRHRRIAGAVDRVDGRVGRNGDVAAIDASECSPVGGLIRRY